MAPGAAVDTTFDLKEPVNQVPEWELQQEILELFSLAKDFLRARQERTAVGLIVRALEYDCNARPHSEIAGRDLVRAYVPLLLSNGRYPTTLAALSEILQEWGDRDNSVRLLRKYVRTESGLPIIYRFWLGLRLRFQFRTRLKSKIAAWNVELSTSETKGSGSRRSG